MLLLLLSIVDVFLEVGCCPSCPFCQCRWPHLNPSFLIELIYSIADVPLKPVAVILLTTGDGAVPHLVEDIGNVEL